MQMQYESKHRSCVFRENAKYTGIVEQNANKRTTITTRSTFDDSSWPGKTTAGVFGTISKRKRAKTNQSRVMLYRYRMQTEPEHRVAQVTMVIFS